MSYDLIVIGGGPAGYWAARRASDENLRTLLIEKKSIGGTCLNEGCIPSKVLLNSAKLFTSVKEGAKFGVVADNVKFEPETVIERKNRIVKKLSGGILNQLKSRGTEIIYGKAKIIGKMDGVFELTVNDTVVRGKNLLIATGSKPKIPVIDGIMEGLENGYVLTNSEFLDLKSLPASLVILGAGAVGLETASYYSMLGCKVTVLEMSDRIALNTGRGFAENLMKIFRKKGIDFYFNSSILNISHDSITFYSNGREYVLHPDYVLLCTGRTPVVDELGIENIGLTPEKDGIKIDETCQTNISRVYAAGDVTGGSMLAHTAFRQADVCVNNILGKKDVMRYDNIPYVIYSCPEIAGVGETEESAAGKGINYEKHTLSLQYSGRFVAENESGFELCEILVDKNSRRLIGVHIAGSYVSEIYMVQL
ncbi:dihydrolipoyl dehydrogenase family protein [Acetivibrio straminisolvens]|uniref:Dihydrolipoamide dehydrogenase n=1 Tax=Acetivibrio straminisolvens JCM 21531 TaxID=1294263 RepID=W4V5X6_9FIRM|nr:NAD(P)/FAD-dependent oxidoreductase [Acetivibrio straminisolvens]GAE88213.1 dihydrolipoamide dehydrogenase [Acetivibrio straminisolvens JCM 21531]